MLTMAELPAAVLTAAAQAVNEYARIERPAEQALVERLAGTGIELCEAFCGRTAIQRAAEEMLPATSQWRRLAASPVSAILEVEGVPAEGAAFPLPVGAYAIDIDAEGVGWVQVTQPGAAGRVRIRYQAGLAADWTGLPEPLAQGVVRLATHLFSHRDAADEAAPPAAVAALWRPWRRVRIG